MNAAGPSIQSSHIVGNSAPCPVSFGQVAAKAITFSGSSSLPASFGKYDSFYLSLRSSGTETRQQQQKHWMRRHQYRGDENVRGNFSLRKRREQKFNSMSIFSSAEKMKDVYEDDFIEAERGCVVGYGRDVGGMDITPVEGQVFTECHNDEKSQQSNHDHLASGHPHEVSPFITPHARPADPDPITSGSSNDDKKMHIHERKHELTPITHGLDDAFMQLTLDMKHSIVTPCHRLSTENHWKIMTALDDNNSSPLSSSVEPVIHSENSSISSCGINRNQSESLSQDQSAPSETSEVCYPSPAKSNRKDKSTPFNSPPQRHSISTNQIKLTPLSHAILSRGRLSTGSKSLAINSFHTNTATVTPKRKPLGTISSSSKRRKTEGHSSTINATLAYAPRPLYNGGAIERIRHVRKCTDEHCRWNPNLHSRKAACERCWTLASESERQSFVENGGRHLRINLVKGGCPSSCKLFSKRGRVLMSGGNNLFDDEDVRLCRKCFDDMHHVGVRQM